MTVVAAGCFARGKAGSTETTPKENTYLPAGITRNTRNNQAMSWRTAGTGSTVCIERISARTSLLGELHDDAAETISAVTVGYPATEAYLAPMKLLPLKCCRASSASRELSNSTKPKPETMMKTINDGSRLL